MLLPVKIGIVSRFTQNIVTNFYKFHLYSVMKMSSASKWKDEKERILALPIEEKRNLYISKDYITIDKINAWVDYTHRNKSLEGKKHTVEDLDEFRKIKINPDQNEALNEKVSIFKGDITKLEIDAIVNAANSRLIAGGGVDGAIHRAAGPLLQAECNSLGGCPTGEARITCGYNLPAQYVIHTVGPQNSSAPNLKSCYENCFALLNQYELRTIAFPCISTGIYGFPNRLAAHIALRTARKFLEANKEIHRVVFCTFMPVDVDVYETLMQMYFPVHEWNYEDEPEK